jgi:hypothetical protein
MGQRCFASLNMTMPLGNAFYLSEIMRDSRVRCDLPEPDKLTSLPNRFE